MPDNKLDIIKKINEATKLIFNTSDMTISISKEKIKNSLKLIGEFYYYLKRVLMSDYLLIL